MNAQQPTSSAPTNDSFSDYLGKTIFGSLDGLRALAILAVLWHHTASAIEGWPITTRGFIGVDLFFVISGFLIATLLLREFRRNGHISLRNFYIRRILRIFPPFYLMLLIVGATTFLAPGNSSTVIKHDLFFSALFLSNLVPMHSLLAITWSLSAEEQFYLLAPLAIKSIRRAFLPLLFTTYILVSLPSFGFFPAIPFPSFFRETTYGPILLGVILAHLLNDRRYFSWLSNVLGWNSSPLFALVILLALLNYPHDDISGWHRMLIHWAMFAFVASCVIREGHIFKGVLTSMPIQRIGRVSYGMYLYHLIVAHFVNKGIKTVGIEWDQAAFVGTSVTVWMVAELSYRYFESPCLALKSRFGSRSRPRATNLEHAA